MTQPVKIKFVARQAILDRDEKVFAYELLYRNSNENFFPSNVSDDAATARLFLDSLLFYGVDNLSANKKLFINLSTSSLLQELPKLINPSNVVLEIIERTEKLEEILPLVEELIIRKYIFALDDYDGDPKWNDLLEKAKFIKLEVEKDLNVTLKQIKQLKEKFPNKSIIVERIEDNESFKLIRDAGADLFQGYYFTKPQLLNFKNINPSTVTILELLKVTFNKPFEFASLIEKVEKDPSLVARLLRLANLRCKTSNKEISSISQAVIYLGEETIKQFVTVLSLGNLSENKPSELLSVGLIRGKFLELLLNSDKKLREKGYLLGIVSIFNALIDVDTAFVIKELSLGDTIKLALETQSGQLGDYYLLCLKVETNDFVGIRGCINALKLKERFVMDCYVQAIAYADDIQTSYM